MIFIFFLIFLEGYINLKITSLLISIGRCEPLLSSGFCFLQIDTGESVQSRKYVLYVDGFNLYYRMVKEKPQYKWLNIKSLFESFNFKPHPITKIRYFTAKVASQDSSKHIRQNLYIRDNS